MGLLSLLRRHCHNLFTAKTQLQLPWLMMSSPSKPESRYLYELTADNGVLKRKMEVQLPAIAGHLFIGSSQGYLLTVPPAPQREPVPLHVDISAINPLTGSTLPLPSLRLTKDHFASYRSSDLKDRHMFVCLHTKAFLSPSLDTFFLLCDNTLFIASSHASHSPPKWTGYIRCDKFYDHNHDCVLYKGRVYASGIDADFVIFYPENPGKRCPIYVDVGHDGPFSDHKLYDSCVKNYLVTSPDGEDLFMLSRRRNNRAGVSRYPNMTCLFMVYKLDGLRWRQVFDLGGLAFFVGANYSTSSYAHDCAPLLKPNSIYFTDDFTKDFSEARRNMIGDSGVFTIEDGRIEIYKQSRDDLLLYWPPPIWLMPTA